MQSASATIFSETVLMHLPHLLELKAKHATESKTKTGYRKGLMLLFLNALKRFDGSQRRWDNVTFSLCQICHASEAVRENPMDST
jgi:hypothetical protein